MWDRDQPVKLLHQRGMPSVDIHRPDNDEKEMGTTLYLTPGLGRIRPRVKKRSFRGLPLLFANPRKKSLPAESTA